MHRAVGVGAGLRPARLFSEYTAAPESRETPAFRNSPRFLRSQSEPPPVNSSVLFRNLWVFEVWLGGLDSNQLPRQAETKNDQIQNLLRLVSFDSVMNWLGGLDSNQLPRQAETNDDQIQNLLRLVSFDSVMNWLGGLDSNQDNQIQNLMYCQLYDLPTAARQPNERQQKRIAGATLKEF